ncbi:17270_t:CDS:2 [Gigaspora rosea]|nr:17270_t:CDS:2 [Gigaspora rosea]
MDKMFANEDTRAFGRNSDSVFKELDQIRKKQISLAVEHISLENLPDEEMPFAKETDEDSEENFKKNSEQFAKKEHDLNNLMTNLNNLIGKLKRHYERSDKRTTIKTAKISQLKTIAKAISDLHKNPNFSLPLKSSHSKQLICAEPLELELKIKQDFEQDQQLLRSM